VIEKIMKCPICEGEGGWTEIVDTYLGGPHETCGYCEGVGKISPWRWFDYQYAIWLDSCRKRRRNK